MNLGSWLRQWFSGVPAEPVRRTLGNPQTVTQHVRENTFTFEPLEGHVIGAEAYTAGVVMMELLPLSRDWVPKRRAGLPRLHVHDALREARPRPEDTLNRRAFLSLLATAPIAAMVQWSYQTPGLAFHRDAFRMVFPREPGSFLNPNLPGPGIVGLSKRLIKLYEPETITAESLRKDAELMKELEERRRRH